MKLRCKPWRRAIAPARALLSLGLVLSANSCKQKEPTPALASTVSRALPPEADVKLLPLGSPLPDVEAEAHTGEVVRLRELKGKPVVVYFYPRDDTPGCTVEAQEIRDLWQDIQGTGAVVVGISVDDSASHRAFAEKHALPFLLLPDPEHRIVTAFGVPLKDGRARRVSFVFGRGGELVKVFPEVTAKGHGRELLETLRGLKG